MEQIGRYRIDGVLGAGAMGTVYKAFDPRIERVVALKTIRGDLLASKLGEEVRTRFRTEARAAGRLAHPHIVTVYDFEENEGGAFIAMEFVQGRGLDTMVGRDAPLPPRTDLMRWMGQLLDALDYAHSQGIAHRDIKPANLLITAGGDLKVADFGIAKIFSAQAAQSEYLAGTPEYMSPEQFLGQPIDGRSDLFSTGVVLYQLLTGAKPFTGSMATVMRKILYENPEPPSAVAGGAPASYDAVIRTAMHKDPAARYQRARDFAAALAAAHRGEAAAPVGDETVLVRPGQGWNDGLLRHLELHLAAAIGPMARVLIRKECARAAGEEALIDALLLHIPGAEARSQFLKAARGGAKAAAPDAPPATATRSRSTSRPSAEPGGTLPSGPGAAVPPLLPEGTTALDPALVQQAEKALARVIGPLARILVRRAAGETVERRDFCLRLARRVRGNVARNDFLRELGID